MADASRLDADVQRRPLIPLRLRRQHAGQSNPVNVPGRAQNFLFTHTRNFSPTWTNEFRFAYGRFVALFQANNPDVALNGPVFSFNGTQITDVGLDSAFPQGRFLNNYQFQDTVTHTFGNHTIRAGVDLARQLSKELVPFNDRGTLTFSAGGEFSVGGVEGIFPAF